MKNKRLSYLLPENSVENSSHDNVNRRSV